MFSALNYIYVCVFGSCCRCSSVLSATYITPVKYLSSQASGPPKRPVSGYLRFLLQQRPDITRHFPGKSATLATLIKKGSLSYWFHKLAALGTTSGAWHNKQWTTRKLHKNKYKCYLRANAWTWSVWESNDHIYNCCLQVSSQLKSWGRAPGSGECWLQNRRRYFTHFFVKRYKLYAFF